MKLNSTNKSPSRSRASSVFPCHNRCFTLSKRFDTSAPVCGRSSCKAFVAQITVPPEDNAEHVVEFGERHVIADRDQADDHRAHLAQNRSQNQAFEGGCFNHHSRLLDRPTPDFLALSLKPLTRSFTRPCALM